MSDGAMPTAEGQVAGVLAAEARRMRRLSAATILAVGAVCGLCAVTIYLGSVARTAALRDERDYVRYLAERGADAPPVSTEQFAVGRLLHFNSRLWLCVQFLGAGVAVLSLAAYGAVLLTRDAMRANARQLRAGLADIAAQLDALRGAPPGRDGVDP